MSDSAKKGGVADDAGDRRQFLTSRRLRVFPMKPRDIDEEHRVSTALELLFDLCFVVAVSQAADQLHIALLGGHFHTAIVGYLTVFFGIWWAWVNFTWFASAYDVDDLFYRLLTFVQIIGVLILAAGVDNAFSAGNYTVMTIGYVVMRVAMVVQWLRAASGDPVARPSALRYAVGIAILQVGWVLRLFLPPQAGLWSFYVLALCEMLLPAWAERAGNGAGTPWHPGHISERYGLFTLIVLGECIAAVTIAIHGASSAHGFSVGLVAVIVGAVLLVFSIWWWYFENPAEEGLRMSRRASFIWGYGHYVVFGSIGALGAGLELAAEGIHGTVSSAMATTAGLAVAVPVAAYLVVTGLLQGRLAPQWPGRVAVVGTASVLVLVLGGAASALGIGLSAFLMGAVVALLVVCDEVRRDVDPREGAASF
jgi:low temperature requirement protein LtrA